MSRLDTEGLKDYRKRLLGQRHKRPTNWNYLRKLIVIFATMLLAAGRTALVLFNEALAAAQSLLAYGVSPQAVQYYGLGMAFLSLLAVEGYLVNTGIDRGQKIGQVDQNGQVIGSIIPAGFSVSIAVAISMLAGLGVSIAPVEWLEAFGGEGIRTVLGVVVGIGVSILAYAAGEDYCRAQSEDTQLDAEWEQEVVDRWTASRDRKRLLRHFLFEEKKEEPKEETSASREASANGNGQRQWFENKGGRYLLEWYITKTGQAPQQVSAIALVDMLYKEAGIEQNDTNGELRRQLAQRVRSEISRNKERINGNGNTPTF